MGKTHADAVLHCIEKHQAPKRMKVILTHIHWDHIWGTGWLDPEDVIASERTYQRCLEQMASDI